MLVDDVPGGKAPGVEPGAQLAEDFAPGSSTAAIQPPHRRAELVREALVDLVSGLGGGLVGVLRVLIYLVEPGARARPLVTVRLSTFVLVVPAPAAFQRRARNVLRSHDAGLL